jgi:IS30 family transposase
MGLKRELSERERYDIELLLKDGKSIKEIAYALNRHYLTIWREIKRGTVELIDSELRPYKKYCADVGQRVIKESRKSRGTSLKIGNDMEFVRYVEQKIGNERYSPDAVLYSIETGKLNFKTKISRTTLYRYIDIGIFLNISNKDLPVKRDKKKQVYKNVHRVAHTNLRGRSIEKRPDSINDRSRIGHWEMDTVVGGKGASHSVLLVLTERVTRNELLFKIPDKSMNSVVSALDRYEKVIGTDNFRDRFKSITMDNGSEFYDQAGIERSVIDGKSRTIVYYCHPYCSFERGSNENQNKLVRRWIPKGSDIGKYSDEDILRIQDWINHYPRKMFGGKSSADFYA